MGDGGKARSCMGQPWLLALAELVAVALAALGVFVSFGPYQDDRTWNLVRDSARSLVVDVPEVDWPTHFRLREVQPIGARGREQDPRAKPVLFLPGHQGKWTQVINVAAYLGSRRSAAFFAADFHASASALHPSIVLQQAAFAAAAVRRIRELYKASGQADMGVTLVGHSMGGVVAQQALRLLHRSGHGGSVSALLLVSTPVLGHPLLLEQGMASLAEDLRRELWRPGGLAPPTVAVSGGETDPLIPSEVATLPEDAAGISLAMPTMHNVHASFSHVNLLFSWHSLHVLGTLVGAALDGRLLEVAAELRSPLVAIRHKLHGSVHPLRAVEPEVAAGFGAAVAAAESAAHGSERGGVGWLVRRPDSSAASGASDGGAFAPMSAAAVADAVAGAAAGAVAWSHFEEGRTHVLPAGVGAAAFSLLLLEKPRPIRRSPERTTRGEDFEESDKVDCGSLASVRIALQNEPGAPLSWSEVTPLVLQYPAKACLFHVSLPPDGSAAAAVAAIVERPVRRAKKGLAVSGWAQWDGMAPAEDADPHYGSAVGWAAALIWPVRLRLPAGRAVVSRLALPLVGSAPFLPLDLTIEGGSATPWGVSAIFAAVGCRSEDAHVTALRRAPASTTARRLGWASESDPEAFTPRFAPGPACTTEPSEAGMPAFFVMADPSAEMTVLVRVNCWAVMSRCFRTYLGYVLAAWLGATLALQVAPSVLGSWLRGLAAWAIFSLLLAVLLPDTPGSTSEAGFSPGAPPLVLLVSIHALGVAFAFASWRAIGCLASAIARSRGCCCKRRGLEGRRAGRALLELAGWGAVAAAHPSGCSVAMCLRGLSQVSALYCCRRASLEEASVAGEVPTASDAAEAEEERLKGLTAVLGIYLLCHAPSIVLTVWVLLGQHREASTAQLHDELQAALPTSRDAPTPWVDSWLLPLQRDAPSALPFLGLLVPAVALAAQRARAASGIALAGFVPGRARRLAQTMLFGLAVVVVAFVRHRTHRVWLACQPALLLHALVAMVSASGLGDRTIATKSE